MAFSTPDQDHDKWSWNCAASSESGWWFNQCQFATSTGVYRADGGFNGGIALMWRTWRAYSALKTMDMKIRPV
jgi:hypothetical protein